MKLRIVAVTVLSACALLGREAKADRGYRDLEELVEMSTLVVMGAVEETKASKTGKNIRIADVALRSRVLKGAMREAGVLRVPYEASDCQKSLCPVQLEVGEKYCFFLREDKDGYALVDRYDGAYPARGYPADGKDRDVERLVREAIENVAKVERQHKNLQIALSVQPTSFTVGEKPVMTFEVVNKGDEAIRLPGKIEDKDGKLYIDGMTYFLFTQTGSDGRTNKLRFPGGVGTYSSAAKLEQSIGPGEKLEWSGTFHRLDLIERPGRYEVVWMFGKAASQPTVFEINPGAARPAGSGRKE